MPDIRILQSIEIRPIKREERAQWGCARSPTPLPRTSHPHRRNDSIRSTHHEQWLALIGWSAAALKCKARDQWIGWPSFLKTKHLAFVANNSRFLILPSIHIPNLASRVLALNLKRLSDDWQTLYGHPSTWRKPLLIHDTSKALAIRLRAGYSWDTPVDFPNAPHVTTIMAIPRWSLFGFFIPMGKECSVNPLSKTFLFQEVKPMQLSLKHAESLKEHLSSIPDPRLQTWYPSQKTFRINHRTLCNYLQQIALSPLQTGQRRVHSPCSNAWDADSIQRPAVTSHPVNPPSDGSCN